MSDDNELGIVIDDTPALATPEPEEVTQETPVESQVKATPEEPLAAQSKIAEHEFKRRKAERENAELRKKLAEKENPQTVRPVIPEVPNPLAVTEAQFNQQQAAREEAIRQAAIHDEQQKALRAQAEQREAAQQREYVEGLNKATDTYKSRAVQLGVKPEELLQAGQVVAQYGIADGLAEFILHDEQGALITKYLASNLDVLDGLKDLPEWKAAIVLETVIKPKAASLKPRVSNAPPPQDAIGSGIIPMDYGVPGATFE